MRILFLDIDGVLNSTFYQKKNIPVVLEEKKLNLLIKIIKLTQAKIVLTSLRKNFDWDNLVESFAKYEIELFDKTPNLLFNKEKEINAWLNNNSINSYVVVDDMDLSYAFKDKFIKINPYFGLTNSKVEQIIKQLLLQK